MTRAELQAEAAALREQMDRAYWTFTRSKRGKPPVLALPHVHARQLEVAALLVITSPCDAVHIASTVDRSFHTIRLACGCLIRAFADGTAFTDSRACTDSDERRCDARTRSAFEWFSKDRGPRHPSLFPEFA